MAYAAGLFAATAASLAPAALVARRKRAALSRDVAGAAAATSGERLLGEAPQRHDFAVLGAAASGALFCCTLALPLYAQLAGTWHYFSVDTARGGGGAADSLLPRGAHPLASLEPSLAVQFDARRTALSDTTLLVGIIALYVSYLAYNGGLWWTFLSKKMQVNLFIFLKKNE